MNNGAARSCGVCVTLLLIAAAGVLSISQAALTQDLSVSIPHLKVANDERVVGFEIHVTSGRISSLPDVPIGWSISIDNDPSWNTNIKASSKVGAAALGSDFFRKFLIIEKNTSTLLPFDLRGEIEVTKTFATARHITLHMSDFAVQRIAH